MFCGIKKWSIGLFDIKNYSYLSLRYASRAWKLFYIQPSSLSLAVLQSLELTITYFKLQLQSSETRFALRLLWVQWTVLRCMRSVSGFFAGWAGVLSEDWACYFSIFSLQLVGCIEIFCQKIIRTSDSCKILHYCFFNLDDNFLNALYILHRKMP